MSKICKAINGVLVLLAGVELFFDTSIAGLSGFQIAGLLLVVFGLCKLAHAAGLCGMCGTCCVETKKK